MRERIERLVEYGSIGFIGGLMIWAAIACGVEVLGPPARRWLSAPSGVYLKKASPAADFGATSAGTLTFHGPITLTATAGANDFDWAKSSAAPRDILYSFRLSDGSNCHFRPDRAEISCDRVVNGRIQQACTWDRTKGAAGVRCAEVH